MLDFPEQLCPEQTCIVCSAKTTHFTIGAAFDIALVFEKWSPVEYKEGTGLSFDLSVL